jgi:hypothetical protein
MRILMIFSACIAALLLVCCSRKSSIHEPSLRTVLPLLSIKPIQPIKDKENFTTDHFYQRYHRQASAKSGDEAPYATENEAAVAAESFLREHFGELPFVLKVTKIQPLCSGSQSPDCLGHTVTFSTVYQGYVLAGYDAIIYFRGKTIELAYIRFGIPKPIPHSEKNLISREQALAIWKQHLEQHFGKTNIKPVKVELHYVWFPKDNIVYRKASQHKDDILRPNWMILPESGYKDLFVDAFEGTFWRND